MGSLRAVHAPHTFMAKQEFPQYLVGPGESFRIVANAEEREQARADGFHESGVEPAAAVASDPILIVDAPSPFHVESPSTRKSRKVGSTR